MRTSASAARLAASAIRHQFCRAQGPRLGTEAGCRRHLAHTTARSRGSASKQHAGDFDRPARAHRGLPCSSSANWWSFRRAAMVLHCAVDAGPAPRHRPGTSRPAFVTSRTSRRWARGSRSYRIFGSRTSFPSKRSCVRPSEWSNLCPYLAFYAADLSSMSRRCLSRRGVFASSLLGAGELRSRATTWPPPPPVSIATEGHHGAIYSAPAPRRLTGQRERPW